MFSPTPTTYIEIESHRHELALKCYCNACETERDPETWVYCCEECDNLVAHMSCAGEAEPFPFIELGGTRKIESHDHPLALIIKKEDRHRRLDNRYLSGLVYQCTKCSFNIDFLETLYASVRRRIE
ncbi:hypothetical protein LOK49_LG10G03008 [Camellia lanceoleosa]|uniref:Uncharacterized protein n=1 Tax=Camellia lanceoleosa TaxID=1840588 RepID=A0ACC0GB12_9ERIC|nr:hypothetical protein LOK49_LG10G03008 [Camellia lanceoleosa]